MSCISRTPNHPLTTNQRGQLRGLLAAGAIDRETAVAIDKARILTGVGDFDGNTLVIGALRDKGLAESRSRSQRGRGWTEYWLTGSGVAKARELEGLVDA